jgi:hypothetical protein
MSAEIAGFASKWRTQRRSRGEQRDHGTAGIARRPEPRLSFTQDVQMGRVSGKCRSKPLCRSTRYFPTLPPHHHQFFNHRLSLRAREGTTMQSCPPLGETFVAVSHRGFVQAHERDIIDELEFLTAWEKGLFPSLSAFLRVRQIRRAHPGLTTVSNADSAKGPNGSHQTEAA